MNDSLVSALDGEDEEKAQLRRQLLSAERRILRLEMAEKQRTEAIKAMQRLERELGVLASLGERDAPPDWLKSPPRAGVHTAIPWLTLSDLHLDEVVEPAEVLGMNAYNRTIARQRLERTFEGFVKVTRDHWSGIAYDGCVVPMIGDIFSGDIHEELTETNEDTVLGSIDYWVDPIAAGLSMLADEFGHVHVPTVVGNHGRTTRKPRAKHRARSNFDWMIGKVLQRMFAKDDRVTFDISDAADLVVDSYGQKVMLTHGDQVRGGGGIGGIWPPIKRLEARKKARQTKSGQGGFDLLVMGHWHQLVFGESFVVNGAMKGIDEYSFVENFGFEPPAQAAWLMTPEHGITFRAPIWSQDRDLEGW
jgi:predicted phosphodiesterase